MKTIFLHGLGQNSDNWKDTVKLLGDEADCPDLFNLKIENFTYDCIYKSLEKYLQKYKEPINICGLSLGGMLALNYAINNPLKVKSLAVIGVQYVIPKMLMQIQNLIFKFLPNKIFKSVGIEKKDAITLITSMLDLNFENELQKIKCPVIVICGEKDIVNKRIAVKLSQLLVNAEYKEIEKAGHEVNKNNPQQLAEILKEFYNKLT